MIRVVAYIIGIWICSLTIGGCEKAIQKPAKPSAGIRYVVPPQCFSTMYCSNPECRGSRAVFHCYSVEEISKEVK